MAYQSLYRRYRSRRFSDVRGQQHVVKALRNAVREDRVGHAYLFSGPRGTGKTSSARILAKALNCEHLVDGEPDGTCDSCLAIDAGTSYDVQELDAASNNRVEHIEDLIGRVNLGSPGRTKVYILDEVHMLTTAAANKLLKTLEEPPDHVVFVLATTDPQKVLPTIRSRTQHFEFHLISAEELAEHVAWVIHDAGLDVGPDVDAVIQHVVRVGGGSARDTLSALDQVAAAGGVLDRTEALEDLMAAIVDADPRRALVAVADAVAAGRDPRLLGEAVLARLRDVFLVRMGAPADHLAPGDLERVQALADGLGDRATTRALEAVGEALLEMRQAPEPRIPLEVALVKLTRSDADASIEALSARVAALEAALAAGAPTAPPAAPPSSGGPAPAGPAPSSASAPPSQPPTTPAARPAGPAPAPPPRQAGRPADEARALLAARRAGGIAPPPQPGSPGSGAPSPSPATPPAAATAPAAGPPATPPAPARADVGATGAATPAGAAPAVEPTPPTRPTPVAERAPAPSETAPAPSETAPPSARAAGPAPSGGVGIDHLTATWTDTVLPSLGGLTKAMYSVGRFTDLDGAEAVFALPNEVHRQKCERKRAEVEAALGAQLGAAVTLRLTVDEQIGAADPAPRGRAPGERSGAPAAAPDDPDLHLDGSDVHDLPDAPDAASGGLDAVIEAFPGSEFVE